jgi:hypothetical protein
MIIYCDDRFFFFYSSISCCVYLLYAGVFIIVVIVLKSGKETENDGFNFYLYSLNLYFRYYHVSNATKNK